jgi:L-asparaginase/beta-aspartyl-peptidase (threonine type)
MSRAEIITHGGAGAPGRYQDGPQAAAVAGLSRMGAGEGALSAAVAAAVLLEDDPRFNAGTGSHFRLDGRTIEMDAAVMTSDGRFGAVLCLRRTRNPVRVAEAVTRTPHLMLAGRGAQLFARRLGHPDYNPATPEARQRYRRWKRHFASGQFPSPDSAWHGFDIKAHWNFPHEWRLGDTIGAVARDAEGNFAVANSTGGTATMLLGRVGDTPIYGAGLFAGPHGAVAATGEGEEIVRRILCLRVYERIAAGVSARHACAEALATFPPEIYVGLIALDRTGSGSATSHDMPVGHAGGDAA